MPLKEAEKINYFDDSGEFLFSQIEKPLHDEDSQPVIAQRAYNKSCGILSTLSDLSIPI